VVPARKNSSRRIAPSKDCTILIIPVPVKNMTCHYYRDATIRQQLGFNTAEQLVHMQTDMNPFHFGKIPFLDIEVSWGE
jgi:hypothetical protein